jgi:hypothetical protein
MRKAASGRKPRNGNENLLLRLRKPDNARRRRRDEF